MHDHAHGHHHGHEAALVDEPMDAANNALSNALMVSFRLLKGIMAILVILYLTSNVRCIEGHQNALVLRLGKLMRAEDPGLVTALPFPIEEVVTLPTTRANTLTITSHTFHRRENEDGRPLSAIARSEANGLDPQMDGYLVTSDKGIVHVDWKLTYQFEGRDGVKEFVSNIIGGEEARKGKVPAAEALIKTIVETVGVHVASTMTAEELIRTRVSEAQEEMNYLVNRKLTALETGLRVTSVEMSNQTPPIAIRQVFDNTQMAENNKRQQERQAEGEATQLLNDAAGASHEQIIGIFGRMDAAKVAGDVDRLAELKVELQDVLLHKAEGDAGKLISEARSFDRRVFSKLNSDIELFNTLVPEFESQPDLLVERLWQQTLKDMLSVDDVRSIWKPDGVKEFRIIVGPDKAIEREEARKKMEQRTNPQAAASNEKRKAEEKKKYHPVFGF